MNNIITQFFRRQSKRQGCIVVIGDDVHHLSQAGIEQSKQKQLHVYQVLHDAKHTSIQIECQRSALTTVYLNLVNPVALKSLMQHIRQQAHHIELCIFQPSFKGLDEEVIFSTQQVELQWQNTGLSAVSISQIIIKHMLAQRQGTFIFLGLQDTALSNADLLAQSMFASIRALSQSLAREFHPKGIHVAYCMLEKWDSQNQPLMKSIDHLCWHIHTQPNSTWSQEVSIGRL
ncbi:oxidoreductase [Acinetobacter sp. NIPH 2699]|uniref:oxidoreductase n=1 Tax=Acinetobacter sp. NIPH 2699 TaxID=2923433 RepID=UPI001F4B5BBD|nr:oxidoreductase [Acinetobacter sp. NIPH 2699]MCH7336387.1 oxidoreductase [Acinetobacter sp. NIPH 2699]